MKVSLRRTHAAVLSAIALLAVVPMPGWAQSVPSPTAPAASVIDPPGRVARLNYLDGSVTMEPAGATDWAYAELNRPLTTGDQLWADTGARGELHVGSTALRLNQQTALSIVDIDDKNLQLKVTQGALSTRVRALPPGQTVEIDTPNVAMQASSPGEFRVDVAPDGSSTTVTLRSGTANLYGDGGVFQMTAGQQITFIGVNLQQQPGGPAPAPDAFDQWVISRDRAEDASASARYVSREIPGYEDLDANGTWRSDPNYGEVWVPTVAVTTQWAPYHQGHWTWIAPWGWTWIDDAPWGFAPFHYGRWAYLGNAWAWVPGPVVVAQPVYAPALVAFVGGGGGGHWGVDLAIGGAVGVGVAWFALGPHEPWHPGSGYSPSYYNRVNNVNITNVHNTTIVNNITNIHNTYINQRVPGAITAVPADTFVHGQQVAQASHRLTAQQISGAQIGAGTAAIAPVRGSFTGGMRTASVGAPAMAMQRQVVATRAPVVPAAYRDTLAQHYAGSGGRVAGAGEPIVRTTVPAAFVRPLNSGASAAPSPQGYRLVNRAQARPVGAQGAPAGNVQANAPREEARAPQAVRPAEPVQQQRAPVAAENGAPRPPGENAGHEPAVHAGRPAQNEPQAPRQEQAMREPNVQQQHAAPQAAPRAEEHARPVEPPVSHVERPQQERPQPARPQQERPQPERPQPAHPPVQQEAHRAEPPRPEPHPPAPKGNEHHDEHPN
ncbi:FecR family protein [Burkholderia sp. D7]|nr:FecR family protein [Burkholderia sp. D7]